jgi:hypothetical protein
MIKTTIYIPASRKRVFSTITAYGKYPEWTPGCESCTVISAKGSTATTEMVVNSPRRIRLGIQYETDADSLVQFEMVSGKDLRKYSGVYRLVTAADGKGTVLFAELDVEIPSIPRFITDGIVKKSMDQVCQALKHYIEKLPGEHAAGSRKVSAQPAARRARRLLQIVKGPKSYRVWFLGEVFSVKRIEGNVFDA